MMSHIDRIVEIDAGEDGENVGLQERHKKFKQGDGDRSEEWKNRNHADNTASADQRNDEAGENLQDDVSRQHVCEQTNRQ